MQTEHLEEFVTFSRFLNLTKAAEELHMSQSNLGKHIRKLEGELGFMLVDYSHKKLQLTKAGEAFLEGIQPQLESLDRLVQTCSHYSHADIIQISVQDPPFADQAAGRFFDVLNRAKATHANLSIKFLHLNYKSLRKMLQSGKIDVLLEYRYGLQNQLVKDYQDAGIAAYSVGKVPFCLWCNNDSGLADNTIPAETLNNLRISTFSDESSPLQHLVSDIYGSLGIKPKLNIINASSPEEFYHSTHSESVFLLPTTYQDNFLFTSRSDMRFVKFERDAIVADVFALTMQDSWYAQLLKEQLQP